MQWGYKKIYKNKINEDLVMTKKDDAGFKNSTKCWICDNNYIDNDAKMRSLSHYWKWRGSTHRDCNINLKSNHKISVVCHCLKKYDSHLIMQRSNVNLKINVIQNGLEKYMSFSINNKLSFIDNFQFLRFSFK